MDKTTLITYLQKAALLGGSEESVSMVYTVGDLASIPTKALPIFVTGCEARMRATMSVDLGKRGRALVAWSGFTWHQHVIDALSAAVAGESVMRRPFDPAEGFEDGYGQLSVEGWGWSLPIIELEESDR